MSNKKEMGDNAEQEKHLGLEMLAVMASKIISCLKILLIYPEKGTLTL